MSNPWKQMREAAETTIDAAVADVKKKGIYNGEDWAALASVVARDRRCYWTRISNAEGDTDGPLSTDCSENVLHVIVGASAVADRALAAEAAEQLAWDIYAALKQSKHGLTWLGSNYAFKGMQIEHQTPNGTIISLFLAAHADLADWTE